MKLLVPAILVLLAGPLDAAPSIVGDWPFDRTTDGVAVTDGQTVLEEQTAGLFDASGNWAMGQARHYSGTVPSGPAAAAAYARWKDGAGRGKDRCALDTSCGGVYFPDGSPRLKAATDFSVWTRFCPLNADTTKTEIVLGRRGAWLICRDRGRLAAGVADQAATSNQVGIRDVFAGNGPVLETNRWHDIGFTMAGDSAAGCKLKVYLDGVLVKQAMEKPGPGNDAPFQIGGRSAEDDFPDSKSLYNRVVVYDGVLAAKDLVRLSREGGSRISSSAVVAEPLAPTFWWNAGGEIGHESGYEPLKWNPVNDAFCPTEGEPSAHGPRCEFWQKNQRILFTPVLAPQAGYFGAGGASPGRIARYSIASYYIPAGYDRQSRRVTGAVHLHSSQGEEAPGAKLELRVYVNDDLKLIRTIASQKEAVTFAAEVGRLSAGDRIQVAFGAGALGDQGGFWFDYKVELQPSGKASLPETLPVADAFRVDTATPIEENTGWTARHYQLCAMAGTNEIDLLFVGDSVTAGWDGSGKGVWDKQVQRYHPANFGISGEGTQDVLWRITHRELDGLDPKVVVVLLGSNDINWPSAQIAGGVAEVVRKIRARLPHSRVFLMGILPRGEQPNTIERVRALEANAQLQKLDAGRQVQYFYFGDKLLLPDGRMTRETAPDFLHPREGGYQFWMESIRPGIEKALGVKLHPNG